MSEIIRSLSTRDRSFQASFAAIRERGSQTNANADTAAREIVSAVRERGDKALLEYTRKFDGVDLSVADLKISADDLRAAVTKVPAEAIKALRLAARRIRDFHAKQRSRSWSYLDGSGLRLGQQITPLRRVGVYVPGGHAAYPSSVLMTVIPARVAGVEEVIMVSPAGKGGFNPAVLAAASIAGVDQVFRIGGAQAVAALAYGTATVPQVDKIVGPGNAYVQAAKKLVYGVADIDKMAGPSEVLVIADDSADPTFVAADLLAQAEHGSGDECAVMLSPSRRLIARVEREIAAQLEQLPRREAIAGVLRQRGALIHVRNLDEAVEIAEQVAPEHLELMIRQPQKLAPKIRNSGAIFLGSHAPAPLGDYLAGPNHVLPTGGTARFFSPLGVYDFVKRTSIVEASPAGLRRLGPSVAELARLEGYEAHAVAVEKRYFTQSPASRKRTKKS